MTDYQTFLASKRLVANPAGFEVSAGAISPMLFGFQRAIVTWALKRGRAAVFADCGLGKGPIALEWARLVAQHTGKPVLILAPLAVSRQFAHEAEKFGVALTVCRSQADVQRCVNVTNYEMLAHFDPAAFGGVVLDESSILKGFDGATRRALTAFASGIRFRLACTATPAPNDLIELTNHAEFLDILSGKEIIALFFTQDGNTTHAWRLKGHAVEPFYRWMASWAVALRAPSDLGYPDEAFRLPPLTMEQVNVGAQAFAGTLFPVEALTLGERQTARRESVVDRVAAAAAIVNASDEQWIVWCDLNAESAALAKAIPGAVEVTGSDTPEHKEQAMLDFISGRVRVLVSKPSIFGFGMNLQNCARMVFVGLSDSYEALYQAIRRCWRFGQTRPVTAYIVTAETEGAVVRNIERKEAQARALMAGLVRHMKGLQAGQAARDEMAYLPAMPMVLPEWLECAA